VQKAARTPARQRSPPDNRRYLRPHQVAETKVVDPTRRMSRSWASVRTLQAQGGGDPNAC
jgi:hypothetical protein